MLFRGMSLRHPRPGCFGVHRNTFPRIGGTVSAFLRQQPGPENRMLEPNVIVVVASTFLLAGMVKGVIGLGLPAVILGRANSCVRSTKRNVPATGAIIRDKSLAGIGRWSWQGDLASALAVSRYGHRDGLGWRPSANAHGPFAAYCASWRSTRNLLNGELGRNPTDNSRASRDVGRSVGWSRERGADWYDWFLRRAGRDVSSGDRTFTGHAHPGNGNIVCCVYFGACGRIAKSQYPDYRARHSFLRCRTSRNSRDDPGSTCSKYSVRAKVSKGFLCRASGARRLHYCQRTGIPYLTTVHPSLSASTYRRRPSP